MPGTVYRLEVRPNLPERLARLEELAHNLWYSWDKPTRALFSRLHPQLWRAVGHSPKAFLKRIDQKYLDDAARDPVFLASYNRVLSSFDSYLHEADRLQQDARLPTDDLIAYFCFEFGFHESLPIYSGGLGILAGDHCKTASDLNLPFVGVGLMFRQGYFLQTIDGEGAQHSHYADADFDDLPVTPVLAADGTDLHIDVDFPGRKVACKIWLAQIGRVRLFLLDADVEGNAEHDRHIAHRLYGGDHTTRIEQEILLGVGGVRALEALGLKPTIWHINEGHAAFLLLERMCGMVRGGASFAQALEAVACNTVFTTHTPVPAGHDHFSEQMIEHYFRDSCSVLKAELPEVMSLGQTPLDADFNMTALAIRASRFHNGVSRIHGNVSAEICSHLWPQIEPQENPIDHITNGVHAPTFLSVDWHELFDRHLGPGWAHRLTDAECWQGVMQIPDHQFWSVHQSLKSQMLHLLRDRMARQHARNHGSEAHLDRLLRLADPLNPNILTIGFARRFATYKRATLLFTNLDWLREIVSDQQRPVLFIFAGKAHPADQPGQQLIRRVAEVARMPEFESRILLVEGYDLRLARRLVSGCDVWLNNPVFPLEASGTSGMKAAMNGVINLSILDGWWGEGYDGSNGWGIKPVSRKLDPERRDLEESRTLYELLQDSVLPLYYAKEAFGYSPGWVALAKRSIASLMPRFCSTRMLDEYVNKFYQPASAQWRRFSGGDFDQARALAEWKARIRRGWHAVSLRRVDDPATRIGFGEGITVSVAAQLGELRPEDVTIELLLDDEARAGAALPLRPLRAPAPGHAGHATPLEHKGRIGDQGEHLFALQLKPAVCGKLDYRIRIYPTHSLLTHPLEMGMMVWL